jgi:DNA invertase Pin-like site-specific DNA recombinase
MIKSLRLRPDIGVIFHKIDRSARNFRDWCMIGDLNDAGVDVFFATETLDFRSRGGRLSADIQAVIAADYIRNLREETIKGIRGRLAQGLYPFKAPLGYQDNGRGQPKTPDPARARLIKTLFNLYATGEYSIRSLCEEMARRGLTNAVGKPPSKRLIETILRNPFYCGVIRLDTTGETHSGVHKPLISSQLYNCVQDVKVGKAGKKVTKHDHLFRGLFTCGHCGYAMIGERQAGCVYYRCHTRDCPTKSLREDAIERELIDLLSVHGLTRDAVDALIRQISAMMDRQLNSDRRLTALLEEKAALARKLENLTDALIDGHIDAGLFNKRKEALMLQERSLAEEIKQQEALVATPEAVHEFLEIAMSLTGLYRLLGPDEKRQFVKLLTSKRKVYGKSLDLEPVDWLQSVKNCVAVPDGDPSRPKTRRRPQSLNSRIETLVAAANDNAVRSILKLRHKSGDRQDQPIRNIA